MAELQKIGHDNEFISVADEVEEEAPKATKVKAAPDDGFTTIKIERTEEHNGADHAWVSVNGRGMRIPRGIPVRIPNRYVEVLRNGIRTLQRWNERTGEMTTRDIPTYPFQVIHT